MAPMVSASDYPYRLLCRQYGVDLCYTQMLHARNVVNAKAFRDYHFDFMDGDHHPGRSSRRRHYEDLLPSQQLCIAGMEDQLYTNSRHVEGGPLMVQLAGSDPNTMVSAAKIILDAASPNTVTGIDVNLGCPQGIARKGNYGAFLMEDDEDVVMDVLTALRQNLPEHIQVSAKIRLPANGSDDVLKHRMHRLMATGIDFLTIHGRTLHENKTTVGAVHTDKMKLAIDTCRSVRPNDFPIVANGGIEHFPDVQRMLDETGASAIMSSEGLLETPNLFVQNPPVTDPRVMLMQQLTFSREYLYYCAQHPPLPGSLGVQYGSFNVVRGHLFKFLHRYMAPDLRDQLANSNMNTLVEALAWVDRVEETYIRDNGDLLKNNNNTNAVSWYRRHWAANAQVKMRETNQQALILTNNLTLEEKKAAMQARIATLKEQRVQRRDNPRIVA